MKPVYKSIIKRISTHAPHAGSDDIIYCVHFFEVEFQPTLPMRGATPQRVYFFLSHKHFNPRSPCGERHHRVNRRDKYEIFQPTLPMRGATGRYWAHNMGFDDFNPRSPCGERLLNPIFFVTAEGISTHAPHAGSDPHARLRMF